MADPHRIATPTNHAFYFLSGTCRVQIEDQTWHVKPGTFVKVPAHKQHHVTNDGLPSERPSLHRASQTVREQLGELRRILECAAFSEKCCAV